MSEYKTVFTKQRAVREIRERKTTDRGGFTTEKVGEEEVIFNVAVEPAELANMARRAAANKSQRCKDGAVLVEVVTRRRL